MTGKDESHCNPLFSFGVLADVQYADVPNKFNFSQTSLRYYRNSLKLVHDAALSWNNECDKPAFVVHLGDLIDGFNSKEGKAKSHKALSTVLAEFDKFDGPVHHVLGNHDFYNFTRKELWESSLNTTELHSKSSSIVHTASNNPTTPEVQKCGCNNKLYYKFQPHPDFIFVTLDTFDIGGVSHTQECPRYEEGMSILCAINKNTGHDLNSPTGLDGVDKRFVMFNGALGKEQLLWLRQVLEEATRKKQKVFIMGHIPLFPDPTYLQTLLWNYDEVLEVLHQFDCVAAVLSGHVHGFHHNKDSHGVHHVVLPGIVEVKPGSNAFATVDVYQDRCEVRGTGEMPSLCLNFAGLKSKTVCNGMPEVCNGVPEACDGTTREEAISISVNA